MKLAFALTLFPFIAAAQGYCEAGTRIAAVRDMAWLASRNPPAMMEALAREGAEAANNQRVTDVRSQWNRGRVLEARDSALATLRAASGQPIRTEPEAADAIRQACRSGDTIVIASRQPSLAAIICDFSRAVAVMDGGTVCAIRR